MSRRTLAKSLLFYSGFTFTAVAMVTLLCCVIVLAVKVTFWILMQDPFHPPFGI